MAFESRHDAEALGDLLAELEPGVGGVDLTSVADLLRNIAARRKLPAAQAVATVGFKLADLPLLFLTTPRRWALPVDEGFVWEPGCDARPARVVETVSTGRRWSATNFGGDQSAHSLRRQYVEARAAVPGRYGVAGAVALLNLAWGEGGDSVAGRRAASAHGDKLSRLAVLSTDAQALFPDLDWGIQSRPEAGAAAEPVLPVALTVRKPGDVWTAEQLAALLTYVDQRKKADPRLKSETLHEELGTFFSCGSSNIKQQLAAARKDKRGAPVKKAS